MFENSSTAGLIALQIGIMFAILFVILSINQWIISEHFQTVIENQETIIQLLNKTNGV